MMNQDDLAIIKKELSKIRGQLTVLKNKLKSKEYQSDDLVTLYKVSSILYRNL